MDETSQVLIIGCGFLGKVFCSRLKAQKRFGTTRYAARFAELRALGLSSLLFDVNERASWASLSELDRHQPLSVFFMIPPSHIDREVFVQFVGLLKTFNLSRAVLVSSTVVYGNEERVVDADSAVSIDSERAERQFAIEETWRSLGDSAYALRLAGLYGSERVIGESRIIKDQAISGNSRGW